MKKHKGVIVSLVAVVILLSLVCAISITYNFLGGFYYCRVIEYNKVLGEKQTIEVEGEGAYVVCCNFSGSIVINTDIKQPIDVLVTEVETPLYLRAKFGINSINTTNAQMFGYANWVQAVDGYLYFNQTVNSNERVGLCNTVSADVQMELKSSENYVMYFVVEASENEWTYEAI